MTPEDPAPQAADVLVLFGITGDLAGKMLLPALAQLVQAMAASPTTPPPAATVTDASTSGPTQNQNFFVGVGYFEAPDQYRPSDSGY